ncbi:neutral protease 2 [Moniliophthora roreri MCA 2997]|uniref:deuterolysin n=2 Tax=Moniliophthora roreri TaxID=221103 RepID=V2WP52_MONRO|nr:neutral protease 2 [Moniliophthora roreri MCA 2997]KAI3620991.1 neutral protease 2 [Moniliophthora roreri]
MFRSAFVALVLASTIFAGPMKRSSGLTVDVTGPTGPVSDVNQLKFKATVKNTGSEDVKILKYGTILDSSLPTRSFAVTKDGEDVQFTGIKLQVSLDKPDDSSFVSIPAGQSVTVDHDVTDLFDFASAGTGTFRFEPVTSFYVTSSSNDKLSSLAQFERVQVSSDAVEVNVTDQLEKREMAKRATNTCNDPAKKAFIDAAHFEGQALAAAAAKYINDNRQNSLFRSYFKNNDPAAVENKLTLAATENDPNRTLDCNDPYNYCASHPNVIAFTVIADTNIFFCPIFFDEVPQNDLCTGATSVSERNIRGGTALHELTHAVSSTIDVSYGCGDDQDLYADDQLVNADNYNCFATQVWQDTQCFRA